ncbi:SGNH hydrolase [Clostridium estertheticum]|uniref:GDSL-type esterase/lipase family protein n=1 Tax=Clostridium estertheticum TaxID=238834 RepID=UPI001C0C87B0|nr:GDSL-type esterase/lipase family protein [Clostridium estertheticum]MBU3179023.1 SGNH hydrolase [Clostridium estertheticum]
MKNKSKIMIYLFICCLSVVIILYVKFRLINSTNPVSNDHIYNSQYRQQEKMFNALKPKNEYIIFLGDSLTSRGNWMHRFPNIKAVNKGIGGNTTTDVINRLDKIIILNPKKIFLMVGANDLTKSVKKSTTINNYEMIIKILKNKIPNTQIYIQSVLPMNSKLMKISNKDILILNQEIKNLADKYKIYYIDVNSYLIEDNQLPTKYSVDGIHLNDKAYEVWVNIIKKYINS